MTLKILLLQARAADDPMLHQEQRCFFQNAGLPPSAFTFVNLTCDDLAPACMDGHDAIMIGGSGDFSVVESGFDWHEPMLDLLRAVVQRRMPTFGSCFGHQALIQALGGQMERNPAEGEVGTFEITLTPAGAEDRLFGTLPDRFMAQLGHFDRALTLPEGGVWLASSDKCAIQAMRLEGTAIVTTQFHPELTQDEQLERWFQYIEHYRHDGESVEDARARARGMTSPSPESESLLRRFLEVEL